MDVCRSDIFLQRTLYHACRPKVEFHKLRSELRSASVNCPSGRNRQIPLQRNPSWTRSETIFPLSIHTSRFGVIPKKNKPNAWRLILDLSFPFEHSVNDGILKGEFPLSYSTVDDAIRRHSPALMEKIDIKNAYRIVPMHSEDRYTPKIDASLV